MGSSRRNFLQRALAAANAWAWSTPLRLAARKRGAMSSMSGETSPQKFRAAYLQAEHDGVLRKLERDFWEMFRNCRCCPRQCGADRLAGEKGVCGSTAKLKVHSFNPHFGEERPLVATGGSGTIFFSNCNLLCCFCQNWQINHRGDGRFVSHDDLAEMMLDLQRQGCHNINLVTPTHVVPHIIKALRMAIARGLMIPLVYNTGGYDSVEVVKMLDGVMDIYLPDFKYMDRALAAKYSSGAADYPDVAATVIKEMHRQVGELQTDKYGVARRGLIIRHLVMPGNIAGTDRFVRWVARELSLDTWVNIMAQYHPAHKAFDYPELSRRITRNEWLQAMTWAREAGLHNLDL